MSSKGKHRDEAWVEWLDGKQLWRVDENLKAPEKKSFIVGHEKSLINDNKYLIDRFILSCNYMNREL
jgi:hypothetical protein